MNSSWKKSFNMLKQQEPHICTFSSPAPDIFTSFIFHPTAIDDSGPKASCICEREGGKKNTKKDVKPQSSRHKCKFQIFNFSSLQNRPLCQHIIKLLMDHLIFLYNVFFL
jgi:hypothetical protein